MLRYNSFRQHLKQNFDFPISKICVDAGFTCPNRDGTKGTGGCIYCNEKGSGAAYIQADLPVSKQIDIRLQKLNRSNPDARAIVYFQSFSNTYAPVEELRELYYNALDRKNVIGLSIGTRPDCISSDILDLIAEISAKNYLWLEYGVESIHDKTLERVNRKHTYSDFIESYFAAKELGIRICLHLIIGLPGETKKQLAETAKTIGSLNPDGIKLHSFYIESGTGIHEIYKKKPWSMFRMEEYCEIAAQFLEYLPGTTVIHRLVGEALQERLIEPAWTRNKQQILNRINNNLKSWNSYQGARYSGTNRAETKEVTTNG